MSRTQGTTKVTRQPPVATPTHRDWLECLISVTKLMCTVGEIAPFPCLSGVASLVLSILEPIQQLKHNQRCSKTSRIKLCESLYACGTRSSPITASPSPPDSSTCASNSTSKFEEADGTAVIATAGGS
ncbi:hypothetical protein B0H10DRAFT_291577 [Mycena sp. CBHHK59/15]|nr:hypothetical protein B0H10DRAFT_291577 [Mycena sp. CBHHK59/15]